MSSASSKKKSVRLFQNNLLETLTHVPVWVPATLWIPVIFFLLYRTLNEGAISQLNLIRIAALAILTWTLTEYLLHRFLFHAEFEHPKLKRIIFLLHGVHHDYPNDSKRLLMPPLASIPIAALFWLTFQSMMGEVLAKPFFAFFLIGYLIYDYIHYSTHHFRVRGALYRQLKQNHMDHHFVSPDQYFGVSSPLWDHLFGTDNEET